MNHFSVINNICSLLVKYFGYIQMYGQRPDCSMSSQIKVLIVCFHGKASLEFVGINAADVISRQHYLDKNMNRLLKG